MCPTYPSDLGWGGGGGGAESNGEDWQGNPSAWGGAGGGVKVEPMGFLVIRGESVEMLPIDRDTNQWTALAEGILPMLEQWIQQRSQQSPELE